MSDEAGAPVRPPCPNCQGPVTGRPDKIYCCDRCRYAFYSRRSPTVRLTAWRVEAMVRAAMEAATHAEAPAE